MGRVRTRASSEARRPQVVPKETPSERATTPAREGSASGGFLALQRAVGNRAIGELLRSQHRPASPSAVANGGALTIQRRTEVVPKSDDLKKDAPVELFGSNPYEKTLQTIDLYYSLSATDYGQQLVGLDLILKAITAWEAEEGPVGTAVKAGLFGLSRTDQRRLALKRVKDAVTNEQGQVKTQGHTKAVSEHQEDRAKLLEYLNAALASSETLLHNSADWILNAKKAVLYALTPTGDSYARLKQGNKNPAKDEAWFPKGTKGAAGDIASGAVSYNKDDLADNANVNLDDDGKVTGGWNSPGLIAITRPSKKSKETVWETIRHEVQHDADMNKGRDAGAGIRAASEKVDSAGTNAEKQKAEAVLQTERDLQRYKTEYRAYSYEGSKTYAALDNTVQNKTHEGLPFSERQLQIFTHIYKGYAYTKKGWDNNSPLAGGKTFRQAVSEYWNPDTEGFNKLNSARIDDFYRALDAVGGMAAKTTSETKLRLDVRPVSAKEADPDAPSVKALLKAIEGLHGPEADYIANESRQLQDKIDKHLDGAAKQKVVEELKDMAMWSKLGSISLFD